MTIPSQFHAFSIPLRIRFRGMERREGILIRGPAGWGEFSPLPGTGPAEVGRSFQAAYEAAFVGWPEPVRDEIPVNVTVPAVGPVRAHDLVRDSGCTTAKVKVAEHGETAADDIARVEAVRDALGPHGRLRIDVNGRWDEAQAVRMIRLLCRFDLEYVEQPCAGLEELAAVRRRVDVPIAADESIRSAEDPLRVRANEAADLVVLKVASLGGVRAALEIADACALPVVVSSALETSVGIAAGMALAAALPELPYACGLGTVSLLEHDLVEDPLVPVNGSIALRRPVVNYEAPVSGTRTPRSWSSTASGS
uniref:o-succinylbenzoate synthase n=1 Tax=Streptomyces argenteolus TaxID=67274 RepID=A9ZNU3_9ACTN|nr:putative o-succinylbenzoate synthase [Streptomyces argenteolus]